MEDKEAERIVEIFKSNGMRIELGTQFSVKGQIAQLLNGCEQLLREPAVEVDAEGKCSLCSLYRSLNYCANCGRDLRTA